MAMFHSSRNQTLAHRRYPDRGARFAAEIIKTRPSMKKADQVVAMNQRDDGWLTSLRSADFSVAMPKAVMMAKAKTKSPATAPVRLIYHNRRPTVRPGKTMAHWAKLNTPEALVDHYETEGHQHSASFGRHSPRFQN